MRKHNNRNPEKVMILLFPLITLTLFIVAATLWWLVAGNGIETLLSGNL